MIQVHVDISIDPAEENRMLRYFETEFRSAAMKFEGFIEVHMLKLRTAPVGNAPAGMNYRFALTYRSEELRQRWVTSDIHQVVWGTIERSMTSTAYDVLLFDVATARE